MNKQEFIVKLRSFLRVTTEDENSLVEEYEAFIDEAMANGEAEEDVIANLESPEEIATIANEELGIDSSKKFKDYVDDSFDSMKDGYEKVIDSDFMNNVSESIETALKGVGETLKGLDLSAKISKAMDKVGEELSRVKDINIDATFKDMAMKFDNSKVETFNFDQDELKIDIVDENDDALNVEVLGGTSNIVIKSLPTTLMHTITMDDDGVLKISVPISNIKYAERKRMRVYIPNSVTNLQLTGNVPFSIHDVESSIEVNVGDAPISVKDVEGESVVIRMGNGPLSVKDIDISSLEVELGIGPVSIKSVDGDKGDLTLGNGPLSVKDIDMSVFNINSGNGPITIKNVDGNKHNYSLGSGPITVKEIDLDELTITAKDGLMTMKDITVRKIAGDISGTVKTLKNIDAEEFELNK